MTMLAEIFDAIQAGTPLACSCAELDGPGEHCPNPATVISPEGWLLCQEHAEAIDACAKALA